MADSWSYQLRTEIVHARGAAAKLGEIASGRGIKRALVVSDPGVVKAGVVDQVVAPLREASIELLVFAEVEANPTLHTVDRGRRLLAEAGCDGVVAVGGGSAMDAGKVIGLLARNPGPITDYLAPRSPRNAGLPVICVPTTAGTGAEVTPVAGLRDSERGRKVGVQGPLVTARVAVLDPLLTLTLPAGPTRESGMDVLTHAVESFINVNAWDGTRALALRSIKMVALHLCTAVHRGEDLEARDGMLTASLLAGMAFGNTDLGLVHAIALVLGGPYNTPHGITNAIILPHVMRFLLPAAPSDFAQIAEALGKPVAGLSETDAADLAIEAVEELSREIGISGGLSSLGVKREDLPELAKAAATHPMAPMSPRRASAEEILGICEQAL